MGTCYYSIAIFDFETEEARLARLMVFAYKAVLCYRLLKIRLAMVLTGFSVQPRPALTVSVYHRLSYSVMSQMILDRGPSGNCLQC